MPGRNSIAFCSLEPHSCHESPLLNDIHTNVMRIVNSVHRLRYNYTNRWNNCIWIKSEKKRTLSICTTRTSNWRVNGSRHVRLGGSNTHTHTRIQIKIPPVIIHLSLGCIIYTQIIRYNLLAYASVWYTQRMICVSACTRVRLLRVHGQRKRPIYLSSMPIIK